MAEALCEYASVSTAATPDEANWHDLVALRDLLAWLPAVAGAGDPSNDPGGVQGERSNT